MWKVVYIAPNKTVAEMLKNILTQEGLLVMLRAASIPQMGDAGNFEILVPAGEVEEANDILAGVLTRPPKGGVND